MKLYTDADVRQMLKNTDKFTPLHIDYLIKDLTPIELPSDDEILDEAYAQMAMVFSFTDGAKWMRDKIGGNNEQ